MMLALWLHAFVLLALSFASVNARLDPLVWSKIRCSQSDLPTPTYSKLHPVYSVCTSSILNAPLATVHRAILDFSSYPRWNSFVRSVDVPKGVSTPDGVYEGMAMTFHNAGLAPFGLQVTSNEKVSLVQPPSMTKSLDGTSTIHFAASAWKFDFPDALLAAEHPNLLTDLGNGSTLYVSYEVYYAPLSYVSAVLKKQLQTQFENQAKDLKKFVEAMM